MFKNEKGFYKDVSAISGIIDNGLSFGLGIAIGDLNNDGWPDILVGNDFSEKDYLYLNKRNGKFEEVIKKAAKHISYFSMGNDIADINNDGWLDFITLDMMSEHNYDIKTSMSGMNPEKFYDLTKKGLHHQYMYNALQLNNGILNEKEGVPVFSDIAQISNVSNTDWSWGPLLFDMDNDGWKDLFISNGIKKDFRNNDFLKYKQKRFDAFFAANGEQTPQNKQKARALISELVGEMPNRSKPNYFFKNKNGQGYEKKNNLWAKDIATNSNGAVYGDLDNDGDLDIVVNNMDNLAFIYENTARNNETGNFFKVKLRGPKGNLNAVGARVKIVYGKNKQVQEFYPTRGFQSASSTNIHFGLSSLEEIDELTVSWPDGKQSSYKNLKVNQLFEADYLSAKNDTSLADKENLYFKDITIEKSLSFLHQENDYDDFKRESLLPHKLSQTGPALAIGDIDDNGLDDIYIGGAKAQAGKIFLQNEKGNFIEHTQPAFHSDSNFEDTGALFFDADNDGDLDLYVVSGGNEEEHNSEGLNDRLYENINGGFNRILTIPSLKTSGSCVKASDFDQDGDLDLFIGGRQKPGNYPEPVNSFILQNHSTTGSIKFVDVTKKVAPSLLNVGMVTDAIWFNSNGDEYPDLFIVGEWMSPRILQNEHGNFMDVTERTKLENQTGWWFSVASSDIDGDGDEDIIAGNLGMNYKYNASEKEPFEIYQKDFDSNGTKDIVLGYYDLGNLYPLRGRECSSNQVPTIKEKFATYHQFAEATLMDVYGQPNLNNALHYSANTFATSYFENKGDGTFQVHPLKFSSQISSVNTININDFDNDGNLDIVIAGNWYVSEVETPRNDASYGLFLKGDGKGNFEEVPAYQSGLYIDGDVRKAQLITTPNKGKALVIAKNNDLLQLIDIQ
ncbi:VCBS repeat-containing protein [Arenibacter sp. ARW7G5Y1]|uniref:VCBS repeat-containing protein n=1 Tax=Arenibacter sp. ARW7G5Y1 TaxID=2135619 RepID=UPI0021AD1406|nr:VCBS repeat-containing protein [Arenibacter sp. ARW7G5Y1]